MADDTLSQVPFGSSSIIKTRLPAQERYIMASMYRAMVANDTPVSAFVRHVLILGMEAMGEHEEKRIKEYAEYRVKCLKNGVVNPFESE